MPTTDELQTSLTALQALNTALTLRVTELETAFERIRLHTVQRAQIIQLTRTLELEARTAVQAARVTGNELLAVQRRLNDVSAAILDLTDSFIINEEPTGTKDSSNKDFVTANPYKAGSLTVYLNNSTTFTDAYYTESDPTTGAFRLDVAPDAADALRVSYILAGS